MLTVWNRIMNCEIQMIWYYGELWNFVFVQTYLSLLKADRQMICYFEWGNIIWCYVILFYSMIDSVMFDDVWWCDVK